MLRLAIVVGFHALLLAAILRLDPELRRAVDPVLVSIISAPRPVETPPPSAPPPERPRAVPRPSPAPAPAATPQPPVEVAPSAAITLDAAPPASPAPAAPAVAPPAPAAAAESPAAAPVPVAPKPVAATPPRFDAAYLNNPRPDYPRAARRLGEHGKVVLRVFVSAQGAAEKIEIATSSGFPRLDQAARDAVDRWRFVPARRGEDAVGAWVLVPITFVLEG